MDSLKSGLVPISKIKRSHKNDVLYKPVSRNDRDIRKLAKSIRLRGILEPLVITTDGFIMSGHRRFMAAKLVGLKEVPCRVEPIAHDHPDFFIKLREFNRQRVKTVDEMIRERVVDVKSGEAHDALIMQRLKKSQIKIESMSLGESRSRAKISPAKKPMLNAIKKYLDDNQEFLPVSDRQIHYALLNSPPLKHAGKPSSIYVNDLCSYKALVDLLTRARLEGAIPFSSISDETRPGGAWEVDTHVGQFIERELENLLSDYRRDYMQSQPNHIEIVGEKNTVHGVVRRVAARYAIPYTIGRGYCSLTPRHKVFRRFKNSGKKRLILLQLSDFDPDGEEIVQSFARSLRDEFGCSVKSVKVALTGDQIASLKLPPTMKAKQTSSNYSKFVKKHGTAAYELEAISPKALEKILSDAIESVIDTKAFNAELQKEKEDAAILAAKRAVILDLMGDGEIEE